MTKRQILKESREEKVKIDLGGPIMIAENSRNRKMRRGETMEEKILVSK